MTVELTVAFIIYGSSGVPVPPSVLIPFFRDIAGLTPNESLLS